MDEIPKGNQPPQPEAEADAASVRKAAKAPSPEVKKLDPFLELIRTRIGEEDFDRIMGQERLNAVHGDLIWGLAIAFMPGQPTKKAWAPEDHHRFERKRDKSFQGQLALRIGLAKEIGRRLPRQQLELRMLSETLESLLGTLAVKMGGVDGIPHVVKATQEAMTRLFTKVELSETVPSSPTEAIVRRFTGGAQVQTERVGNLWCAMVVDKDGNVLARGSERNSQNKAILALRDQLNATSTPLSSTPIGKRL